MPVFHASRSCTSEAAFRGSVQRLQTGLVVLCKRVSVDGGLEDFERELHALFTQAEREVLAEGLERFDVDVPYVLIDGRKHCRVLRASETYTSAVGPVTVKRTLYRAGKDKAVVPLELRAGMVEGHWTPLAARQASFLVTHLTPQECENTLRELGNMAPSKSSLDRLPKKLSARWEAHRERYEAALRKRLSVPKEAVSMAVSLDGVMVPMKDGARETKRAEARAAGRRTKGPGGISGGGMRNAVVLR